MQSLSRHRLLAYDKGRHFASEPHLRIQVLPVSAGELGRSKELFGGYHGELIVICLQGRCRVETSTSALDLAEHDEALLVDGEPFRVVGAGAQGAVVQTIWAPGLNPCRFCWDRDRKFFDDRSTEAK